jgi:hypothetical protein
MNTYFKIGTNDYSMYVNALSINTEKNYSSQTNAAGNTVVDYINKKRKINVGIIPLNNEVMKQLQEDIDSLGVSISFLNPKTKALEENVSCIIPSDEIEYYTIQADNVMFNAVSLTFEEL